MIKLYYDDFDDFWVWVDAKDENIEYSPCFDTADDAADWYEQMKKVFANGN